MARLLAAVALTAALAISVTLLRGDGSYVVVARFQTASLLVKGDDVRTAGVAVGSVQDFRLGRDGQAEVVIRITDPLRRPLREGTQAIIRLGSQAGVANRFVDLRLAPSSAKPIPDGGALAATDGTSAVDLDEVFNTFDPRTRRALSGLVQGSARQWEGQSAAADAGLLYLNPALVAANRLLGALDRDRAALGSFLTESAGFSSDVASRSEDLAPLVRDLAGTVEVLRQRRGDLGSAIDQLPDTMRRANTTFVNTRAALSDLEPLLRDLRPFSRNLRPLSIEVGRIARRGGPTIRSLADLANTAGVDNDLRDLLLRLQPVRDLATRQVQANGEQRPGAFSAFGSALKRGVAPAAFLRPYSVDLTGWFDDFGTSGIYDALGSSGRVAFHTGSFATVGGSLTYVPPNLRDSLFDQIAQRKQRDRCPGAMERGAAYKPTPDFDCDLSQVPVGP